MKLFRSIKINTLLTACLLCAVATLGRGEIPQQGLMLWLDASDEQTMNVQEGRVAAWRSKSLQTACELTADAQARPLFLRRAQDGMHNVVVFDGRNDALAAADFGRQAQTWTLAVLAAPYAPIRGGALASACPAGGNDYDPGFTVDLFNSSTQFSALNVEGAGRVGMQLNQMAAPQPAGRMVCVVVERDAEQIRLWVDGQAQTSRPASPATTVMDELRVGARFYAGAQRSFFNGEVAAVLLYDRILTQQERSAVEESMIISEQEQRSAAKLRERERAAHAAQRMAPAQVTGQWTTVDAFLKDKGMSTEQFEALPVRRDIYHTIKLGVASLNEHYNYDHLRPAPLNDPQNRVAVKDGENLFPELYWGANGNADGTGDFYPHERPHALDTGVSHVVGRNLWACLLAERTVGIPLPDRSLRVLKQYDLDLFANVDHLPSYFDSNDNFARKVIAHDMREGFLGLFALSQVRGDAWASQTIEQMLDTLESLTDEQGHFSPELARQMGKEHILGLGNDATTNGRLIEPLLLYYNATGQQRALKLAGRFARATLESTFSTEGRVLPCPQSGGHIHSITSSLAGIVRYAIQTGDQTMLERCIQIMDVGMPEYCSSWGWSDEVTPDHPADEIGRGESNQTGDLIRAALLLGEAGHARFYELAERYLRSTLLPTQHTPDEMKHYIHEVDAPQGDFQRDFIRRATGGWAMQLPNDRMQPGTWPMTTQDIISGAVHALCECWNIRLQSGPDGARLNLLFDAENDDFSIQSALPLEGRIEFKAKSGADLLVRMPDWVDRASVQLLVGGQPVALRWQGDYLRVSDLHAGGKGRVSFAVPCRTEKETVDGEPYTTTWVGNQVIEILPRGPVSPLPF